MFTGKCSPYHIEILTHFNMYNKYTYPSLEQRFIFCSVCSSQCTCISKLFIVGSLTSDGESQNYKVTLENLKLDTASKVRIIVNLENLNLDIGSKIGLIRLDSRTSSWTLSDYHYLCS